LSGIPLAGTGAAALAFEPPIGGTLLHGSDASGRCFPGGGSERLGQRGAVGMELRLHPFGLSM